MTTICIKDALAILCAADDGYWPLFACKQTPTATCVFRQTYPDNRSEMAA